MPQWLEDAENGLTSRFRTLMAGLYCDLQRFDERVRELDQEIAAIASEHEAVGPRAAARHRPADGLGAVCAGRRCEAVRNGRELAVALGLTPRQHSSGGKERLLGISKRGNSTSARCWSTGHAQRYEWRPARPIGSVAGSWRWPSDRIQTSQRRH